MLNAEIRANADYQKFSIHDGAIQDVEGRMLQKQEALAPILPAWGGLSVLDIGCDFGFWSFLAAQDGAKVLGLDRSRQVNGVDRNLPALNNETARQNGLPAVFIDYEAGTQWYDFGESDVVLMMSLYHHVYQATGGDHESIWFWLRQQTAGMLIWENPVSADDRVVSMNVSKALHKGYNEPAIRACAERYFNIEYEGPALHEETRVVWKLTPKPVPEIIHKGTVRSGAGGATKAFLYNDSRRIDEIEYALGVRPIPGSMNVFLEEDFDWDHGYYRFAMLDVYDRSKGLDSEWRYRPVRMYPVRANGMRAWAMRFEMEAYPLNMVELISDHQLNNQPDVVIQRWQ